jgi:hypothetical protein
MTQELINGLLEWVIWYEFCWWFASRTWMY